MEEGLLQDLAGYKDSKKKSVAIAARGLIGFFRTANPELLAKKDRGRPEKKPEKKPENIVENDIENGSKNVIENDKNSSEDSEEEEITPEHPVAIETLLGFDHEKKMRLEKALERRLEGKLKGKKKGGGSTNEDKKRKKNFKLTKYSGKINQQRNMSLQGKRRVATEHKKRLNMKSRRKFKRKNR